jgi:hypothetical protein
MDICPRSPNFLEDERMFTTTLVVALAGFVASTTVGSPRWHADYGAARQLGQQTSKPLAVFVGSGKDGWNRVSQEGELGKAVRQLLAKNYICVYVDTELQNGRQLASVFEIPKGKGLVVSDQTGKYQAFYHKGDLPNEQLLRYLGKYAEPNRIVRLTETNPQEPERYYPAEGDPVARQPYYQPVMNAPVFMGRSRGSC